MSFDQIERHAVQSWKFFPCVLAKVKTTRCTTCCPWGVSVSDMLSETLATAPSCSVHIEENTYKAKSRLFISPFEVPSSSFTYTQPSAAHVLSTAIRNESLPLSFLLPLSSWASRWTLRLRTWITKAAGNSLQENSTGGSRWHSACRLLV